MSVITEEEYQNLAALANAIKDETKRTNALGLLERMNTVIEGMGDRPITWLPTQIKILQSMSDMDKINADDPRDKVAGSLVAGNRVIPQGTKVVPLMFGTARSLWDKNTENTRKLCSSPDGKVGWVYGTCNTCPHSKGVDAESLPACNKEIVFFAMAEDLSDMYRLNFAKTAYRSGMDWTKEIQQARTNPYTRTYSLNGESYEKKKTIKIIKANLESVRTNATDPDVLAFLAAMATKQIADRKNFLVQYHKSVADRLIAMTEDTGNRNAVEYDVENSSRGLTYEGKASNGDSVEENVPNYKL